MARLEVAGHVDPVARGLPGERARDEVGRLRGLDGRALAARDAADNELRGLGDDANRVHVGGPRCLHADEGEEEREDEREDANADVHVEGELADDERAAYREPEPERPSPDGDLFVCGRGVVEHNVLYLADIREGAASAPGGPGLVLKLDGAVYLLERAPEDGC